MKSSLCCPACTKPITDLHRQPTQSEVSCPSCGQRYGVVYGKLSKSVSIQEAILYLKASLPSFYKRHYTLQITTAERTLKQLQFSIAGKTDVLPVRRGDVISVLYTMQGYVMKKLVAIANHTTGKNYVLPSPIPSFSYHLPVISALTAGIIVATVVSGANYGLALSLNAIGILAYLKVSHSARLSTPPLEGQEHGTEKRLLADQRLIAQQRKIQQRIAELKHERQANQLLIEQLETLKEKMLTVDQALYSARIYRTTSAIKILHQQISNNQRLVREYERALKMIEIEVDTSWIADQLPDIENFTRAILQRLSELKEIEEQNQALKLQLTAYEEVQLYGIEDYQGAVDSTAEFDSFYSS